MNNLNIILAKPKASNQRSNLPLCGLEQIIAPLGAGKEPFSNRGSFSFFPSLKVLTRFSSFVSFKAVR